MGRPAKRKKVEMERGVYERMEREKKGRGIDERKRREDRRERGIDEKKRREERLERERGKKKERK